jgi:hypothetical protein
VLRLASFFFSAGESLRGEVGGFVSAIVRFVGDDLADGMAEVDGRVGLVSSSLAAEEEAERGDEGGDGGGALEARLDAAARAGDLLMAPTMVLSAVCDVMRGKAGQGSTREDEGERQKGDGALSLRPSPRCAVSSTAAADRRTDWRTVYQGEPRRSRLLVALQQGELEDSRAIWFERRWDC